MRSLILILFVLLLITHTNSQSKEDYQLTSEAKKSFGKYMYKAPLGKLYLNNISKAKVLGGVLVLKVDIDSSKLEQLYKNSLKVDMT